MNPQREAEAIQELQGHILALQGRGGDTRVAHVTPGEVVIPPAMQSPELMAMLAHAADQAGIDPWGLRVGQGRINPRTGHEEFFDPNAMWNYARVDVAKRNVENAQRQARVDAGSSLKTAAIESAADAIGLYGGGDAVEALGGSKGLPEDEATIRNFGIFGSMPNVGPSSRQGQDLVFSVTPKYVPQSSQEAYMQSAAKSALGTLYSPFGPSATGAAMGGVKEMGKEFVRRHWPDWTATLARYETG